MLIDKKTPVLVQGITGRHGAFHTDLMLKYGTRIVAGVTPGKSGERVCGVPVFDSVREALRKHHVTWSVLFVPAPFAKQAAFDALNAGLHLVIITEGIPVHDTIAVMDFARKKKRFIIGPNCPGIAVVGECKLGIIPAAIFKKGPVGLVSRSGTLTYEVVDQLSQAGIGQSTVIGIGGDRVVGLHFVEVLRMFEKDPATKTVVLIGEIGGVLEIEAATFIKHMKKPVVSFVAGVSAPPGKHMGHAGAIVYGKNESAAVKKRMLHDAGVLIADKPSDIPALVKGFISEMSPS